MALMGSKVEARRATSKYGVPIVPGTIDPITDDMEAAKIAASIGYPIMLKASAGGGGKGLRLVRSDTELNGALRDARSESRQHSGTMRFMSKSTSKDRGISKSRFSQTVTATPCTSASGNARFNDGIKRLSKNVRRPS